MITTPTKRTKQRRFLLCLFPLPPILVFPCARILLSDFLFLHLTTLHSCLGRYLSAALFSAHIFSATHVHTNRYGFSTYSTFCIQSHAVRRSRVRNETNRDKCDKMPTHPNSVSKSAAVLLFLIPLPLPLFLISARNKIFSFFSVSFFCISLRLVFDFDVLLFFSLGRHRYGFWLWQQASKAFLDLVIFIFLAFFLFPCSCFYHLQVVCLCLFFPMAFSLGFQAISLFPSSISYFPCSLS
ncbi:hypothetical protein MAPG_06372 [Magnaporthiopsis poae ATCC 64411]|uniref:Uncharacterized protein n=1 Tax=Magnaporthiopsis poae (strain ATCC 64411 / 73-15) TaxID=644358 RepID=A0A0C4E1V1_MAGP6|nr:hypothetical protein MAPG_06372 [Magnaporthiopsis poae ATCC 64411]